jgi:hypothetical protein
VVSRAGLITASIGLVLSVGTAAHSMPPEHMPERETGQLLVSVVDSQGWPLPGALVTACLTNGNSRVSENTDVEGLARLSLSCDGRYELIVAFPGYVSLTQRDVLVCGTHPAKRSIKLAQEKCAYERVGPCLGPVVDLDRTHTSTVFSSSFLHDLPGIGGEDPYPRDRCRKPKKKKREK